MKIAVTITLGALMFGLSGCATLGAGDRNSARLAPEGSLQDAVIVGRSTRDDVRAALGTPVTVRFDSGFEVWVYRLGPGASRRPSGEFVILFSPRGVAEKKRTRLPETTDKAAN